ncbi:hypothetical protein K502DRAFT_303899 [Neoconidiobolus thromboides FSU 785]|nr:hypothetical protein K502DRAFT_303899 [Neoconidiobolus thromboides FSU 785]
MSPSVEASKDINTAVNPLKTSAKFTPFLPQNESFIKMNQIIDENRNNDMIYEGFKANHVVHAICSLYKMGASPEILDQYYSSAMIYLEPLTEDKYDINLENYEEYIAIKDAYTSYLKFFDDQVNKLGTIPALKKYIPRVLPGFVGDALHPLIHLGYAVEFDNPMVAAEGLAYAYSHYLFFDDVINSIQPEEISIEDIEQKLNKMDINATEREGLFSDALDLVVKKNGCDLAKLASKFGVNVSNIEERSNDLSIGTVEMFGGSYRQNTFDFFLLHGVTGNHAVRTLLPILEPKDKVLLLTLNFVALTIIFLTQGAPKPTEIAYSIPEEIGEGKNSENSWSDIFIRSAKSLDEHLIKGVRNLHGLQKEFGEMDGFFFKPAAFAALDIPKNDWNHSGIGYLPEN